MKEDTVIQGINFLKGTHICFYGSGKLDSVNLIQNLKIKGVKFPKRRSGVLFYESGELKAATISGRWRYKDTKTLIFDENGNIGSIYSVDDIMEPGFWRSLINKRER